MSRILAVVFAVAAVLGVAGTAQAGTNLGHSPVPGPVHGSILPTPAPSPTGTNVTGDPLPPAPAPGTSLTRSHVPQAVHGTSLVRSHSAAVAGHC